MKLRPPPRELFFAPLEVSLNPNELEMVNCAYQMSKYGHAKQVRDGGGRYFDHPKAAAWIIIDELGCRDVRAIIDALLHDLWEDSFLLTIYRLCRNFGENIAMDVSGLTKLPKGKETTEEYLARVIERGPQAILAKIADRLHNLRTLGSRPRKKQKATINETMNYHLPLLIGALSAFGEPWADYAKKLEQKILEAIAALK